MTNFAIILAGGIGSRIGGDVPKQLLPLGDGRSILEHSVDAFEQADCISTIGIVMHADFIAAAQDLIRRNGWTKVKFVIVGGRERWESSVNAIREILKRNTLRNDINILLHDAARPFVSERIIGDVCTALEQHEAVTVAIPATDTMYSIEQDATAGPIVQDIPSRSTLMCAQTPQAFRLTTIAKAYSLALGVPNLETVNQHILPIQATDDCGIVHRHLPSVPIHIVLGDVANRKITYREDL